MPENKKAHFGQAALLTPLIFPVVGQRKKRFENSTTTPVKKWKINGQNLKSY
jgi:hypothetical protein